MSKISLIIPHYNTPDLLGRCLNSIPDIEDIQVIVVDNNSCAEVVDFKQFPGLERKFTQIVFDKIGNGAGHARNVGLRFVKSKWVLFADADDFFCKDAFVELEKYYNSSADVIMFKTRSVSSESLLPISRSGDLINTIIDKYAKGFVPVSEILLYNLAPWCKLISTELIRTFKIDFDEVKYGNDMMFSTKVACYAQNVEVSNFELYTLTLRSGSLTFDYKQNKENFLCRFDVRIRCNKFLKAHGKPCIFLGIFLIDALEIRKGTFIKGLKMLVKNRMLLAGITRFIVFEIKAKILHKDYTIY